MIFRAEPAAKIMAGEKTVTRRLCTENPRSPWWRQGCALAPGQTFAVQPGRGQPAFARARATSVRREALGRLSDHEARREGFATAEAFELAFTAINGSYDPAALVWRVEFERV